MLRTFTLLVLAAAAQLVHAQCNEPVPDLAIVIDQSGTSNPPPGPLWICGGLDVTILGDFHNLYVEPNSTVQVIGAFNNGYMKGPGTLTADCDTCFWQFEADVTFISTGGDMNFGTPCEPVTFDYTNAPDNGCAINTGVAEHGNTAPQVELAPNPASDRLTVRVPGATVRQVEVVDLGGRTVLLLPAQPGAAYDVAALRPGRYIARVHTDGGVRTAPFSKQ